LLLSVVPTELFPEKKDSFVGSSLINDEDFVFPEGWCCVYENVLYKENEKDFVFSKGCIPRQPQKTQGWIPRKTFWK